MPKAEPNYYNAHIGWKACFKLTNKVHEGTIVSTHPNYYRVYVNELSQYVNVLKSDPSFIAKPSFAQLLHLDSAQNFIKEYVSSQPNKEAIKMKDVVTYLMAKGISPAQAQSAVFDYFTSKAVNKGNYTCTYCGKHVKNSDAYDTHLAKEHADKYPYTDSKGVTDKAVNKKLDQSLWRAIEMQISTLARQRNIALTSGNAAESDRLKQAIADLEAKQARMIDMESYSNKGELNNADGMYCKHCGKTDFKHLEEYDNHMQTHRNKALADNKAWCEECSQSIENNANELAKHIDQKHPEGIQVNVDKSGSKVLSKKPAPNPNEELEKEAFTSSDTGASNPLTKPKWSAGIQSRYKSYDLQQDNKGIGDTIREVATESANRAMGANVLHPHKYPQKTPDTNKVATMLEGAFTSRDARNRVVGKGNWTQCPECGSEDVGKIPENKLRCHNCNHVWSS